MTILAGCSYSYTTDTARTGLQRIGWSNQHQVLSNQAFILPAGASLYIVYPDSSAQFSSAVPRFRTGLQRAIQEVSRSQGFRSTAGDFQQPLDEALMDAQIHGFQFLLTVAITDLQQTDSARHNDHFQLVVGLYDVLSGSVLKTLSVTSERGIASLSADSDDLAYGSASALIRHLYAPPKG